MKGAKYFLIFTFVTFGMGVFAQYDYPEETDSVKAERKSWYQDSKLFFGGVPGLMFGSITYIELPFYVGYKFTPYFWAGMGPFYSYYKERETGYETNNYGGKVLAQLFLIKNLKEKINVNLGDIYIYSESSMINFEPSYYDPYTNTYWKENRKWINLTLLGFGFRHAIGYKSGFSINLLWDVSRNPDYSYPSPEVRIGIDF